MFAVPSFFGYNTTFVSTPVATAATGVGETSFTANWNAFAGATYYLLDVSTSSSFSSFVLEDEVVLAPTTAYLVAGLTANTTYYYRLRASTDPVPITATGGTITYSGGMTIHTFTSSGTFTVTSAPAGATVEALVVAGGGGGGAFAGGGGGAGGLLYDAAKSISISAYTITVGSGGVKPTSNSGGNTNGNNSVFDSLTAVGGGRGGVTSSINGKNGGSGGGGNGEPGNIAGTGTIGQGNNGGIGNNGTSAGGGGGGASQIGQNATTTPANGGNGGVGLAYSISGTSTFYAGGGGASGSGTITALGGNGGGGDGEKFAITPAATNGAANTGGGGGGMYVFNALNGGNGGSGIVIISYPT